MSTETIIKVGGITGGEDFIEQDHGTITDEGTTIITNEGMII